MTESSQYDGLTKAELVEELEPLGLPTDGTKDELVERLETANEGGPGTRGIRGDEPQYVGPKDS